MAESFLKEGERLQVQLLLLVFSSEIILEGQSPCMWNKQFPSAARTSHEQHNSNADSFSGDKNQEISLHSFCL